jgi:hypothetical protein
VIYRAKEIRPRAWVAARAEGGEFEEVLDRVSKLDFDPNDLVLIDSEQGLPSGAKKENPVESKVEILPQDRPELVQMKVSSGGGFLVLADTYFPGWEAKVIADGKATDAAIMPAYGVIRAVQLPEVNGPLTVEMEYRPMSWRVGSMMSLVAWGVLLLLAMLVTARAALVRTARS